LWAKLNPITFIVLGFSTLTAAILRYLSPAEIDLDILYSRPVPNLFL
jgi:Co/Zn/Cd efflux system component